MNASRKYAYALDANIFIQAKNSYCAFAICPGFWKSILGFHHSRQMCSIDQIRDELLRGKDDLADWTKHKLPKSFFQNTSDLEITAAYRELMTWAQNNRQFYDTAKADFAASADGWLIAFAKVNEDTTTVVTHETLKPDVKSRVPIPNVCDHFGVKYCDTFQMLKALEIHFDWTRKTDSTSQSGMDTNS
jgi:hypothetical protein